ncbi:hypothetical protein NC651_026384 [Populus alba x Populus x berolinensis]|nr:hypothetical protein NC651_026384 [Populus alba x Populus x berolinensis]
MGPLSLRIAKISYVTQQAQQIKNLDLLNDDFHWIVIARFRPQLNAGPYSRRNVDTIISLIYLE